MRKKLLLRILLLLLPFVGIGNCYAQYSGHGYFHEPRFGIYFSNPIGLLSKAGLKIEYRLEPENALLVNYRSYWGYFPGMQASGEYRRYFTTRTFSENFVYGRLGGGTADYTPRDIFTDIISSGNNYQAPGTYFFGGIGAGRHFNYGAFFLDLALGLKFTALSKRPAVYNEGLFYSTGPGSVLELNFNFGFQFH